MNNLKPGTIVYINGEKMIIANKVTCPDPALDGYLVYTPEEWDDPFYECSPKFQSTGSISLYPRYLDFSQGI